MNVQNDMIKTHTVSGGAHTHSGIVGTDTGNRGGSYSSVPIGSQNITGGSHSHTYGDIINNPETRPKNFTYRLWKRVS